MTNKAIQVDAKSRLLQDLFYITLGVGFIVIYVGLWLVGR